MQSQTVYQPAEWTCTRRVTVIKPARTARLRMRIRRAQALRAQSAGRSTCSENSQQPSSDERAAAEQHAGTASDQDPLNTPSRRDLLRGAVTGSLATGAPALFHGSQAVPAAQAIPITSRLPPIGQAAPGTYNLGVAAVRDPALYRSEHSSASVSTCAEHACTHSSLYVLQGNGH